MPQQGAHVVHLTVAGARVATAAVDFFHDHRGLGQPQARTTVLLGNERGHPTRLGQGIDKGLGVGALLVDFAVVLVGELLAQGAHGVANFLVVVGCLLHG